MEHINKAWVFGLLSHSLPSYCSLQRWLWIPVKYEGKLLNTTFNSQSHIPESLIWTSEVRTLVFELRKAVGKSQWNFWQIHLLAFGRMKVLQARYLINTTEKTSVAGTAGKLVKKKNSSLTLKLPCNFLSTVSFPFLTGNLHRTNQLDRGQVSQLLRYL